MQIANGLDGLLGKKEPHATFHDARLVAVSLDYRNNEAVATWELCVGDPDDSMRAARERRRTGRLVLSGVVFWVIDPPRALDTLKLDVRENGDVWAIGRAVGTGERVI